MENRNHNHSTEKPESSRTKAGGGRRSVLVTVGGLCLVVAVASAVLLPGLSRYGLWDPPKDWKVTVERISRRTAKDAEVTSPRKKKKRQRAVTEILLAEQARETIEKKKADTENPEPGKQGASTEDNKRAEQTDHPLRRWLIALGLRKFGTSERGARLPIALTAVFCAALLFLGAAWMFDRVTAFLAVAVLLSLPGFVLQARQLTSEMVLATNLTCAVIGLSMLFAPSQRLWIRIAGALLGIGGMVEGFAAHGAVLGILTPLLVAFVALTAWFGRARPSLKPFNRVWYWGLLAAVGIALIVLTVWAQKSLSGAEGFSRFLGAEPGYAVRVLSFKGIKVPRYEWAVFDVVIKNLGYAAFPWVAFFPLAIFLCLKRTNGSTGSSTAENDRPSDSTPFASYASTWVVCWAAVTFLICTYWFLRFGDVSYLGLPGLALVCAVGLRRLIEREEGFKAAGATIAAVILAILARDFVDFPQALAQSHIGYQLIHPQEVSLKRPVIAFAVLFGFALLIALLARPSGRVTRWPASFSQWLVADTEARELNRMARWKWLEVPRIALGGIPALATALVLAVFGWVKLVLYGLVVEPFLYVLWLIQQLRLEWPFRFTRYLFPDDERRWAKELIARIKKKTGAPIEGRENEPINSPEAVFLLLPWAVTVLARLVLAALSLVARGAGRVFKRPVGFRVSLIPSFLRGREGQVVWSAAALFVYPVWALRVTLRAVLLVAVAVGKLSAVLVAHPFVWLGRKTGLGAARPERYWVPAAALPCLVGLGFGVWVGHKLLPDLSKHYSHKAVFDSYHKSKNPERPEPLALYRMESRSAVFYNAGKIISQSELQKRYRRGGTYTDPLVAYLAEPERVYAMVGASHLGRLDRSARKAGVRYYVLDASSAWYVLLSNRLAANEPDLNPLLKFISEEPPSRVGRRINAVFKEPGTKSDKGDVVLLGVEMPQVVYKGHKFPVKLYFKVNSDLRGDWKIFIHFDGPGHRFHGDHDPLGGKFKTRFWSAGTYVTDPYVVPANHTSRIGTPSGVYHVWMGFFRGETRMTVLQGPKDNTNRLKLGVIRVTGAPVAGCGRRRGR